MYLIFFVANRHMKELYTRYVHTLTHLVYTQDTQAHAGTLNHRPYLSMCLERNSNKRGAEPLNREIRTNWLPIDDILSGIFILFTKDRGKKATNAFGSGQHSRQEVDTHVVRYILCIYTFCIIRMEAPCVRVENRSVSLDEEITGTIFFFPFFPIFSLHFFTENSFPR